MSNSFSRRQIIKTGFLAAIGSSLVQTSSAGSLLNNVGMPGEDSWSGFKVGIASLYFQKDEPGGYDQSNAATKP